MLPILPFSQIPGASANQESDLDKEIVERNVEAESKKESEGLWHFSDSELAAFLVSITTTGDDCRETEAVSNLYERDVGAKIQPPSTQSPDFCDSVSHVDWNWNYIDEFNTSKTSQIQGTKYREDTLSNTDACSENEAISRIYESDNTVQRPEFSFFENGKGLKRNSWKDIGSARKQHRSISGASSLCIGDIKRVHRKRKGTWVDLFYGEASEAEDQHGSSFTSEGNTEEILYSAPNIILKEAVHHIGHNVADQREAQTSEIASTRKEESEKHSSHTYESLSQHFGRPLDDARKSFGVSRTAFKAMCRDVGIMRWNYGKRNMGRSSSETRRRISEEVPGKSSFSSGVPPVQFAPVVAHTRQNLISVKATYNGAHIRFSLPDSMGISELEENVIKRLHLEKNAFTIKYQDDEGEWIIIACDEDVQECIKISRISKTTIIKMLIDRHVDNCAP